MFRAMTRRALVLVIVSAVAALVCARLGIWQLSRLSERRALNAAVSARLDSAAVPLERLPTDTGLAHFRRVQVSGRYDFSREVVLTGRSRNGSPGVQLLTPLRVAGSDTVVLVDRGWVYSANGLDRDSLRASEPESASVTGFIETFPPDTKGAARLASRERAVRRIDRATIDSLVGLPMRNLYVVQTAVGEDTAGAHPIRLKPPALDEGPHLSYAIQWFSFATVAIVGGLAFARAERRKASGRS